MVYEAASNKDCRSKIPNGRDPAPGSRMETLLRPPTLRKYCKNKFDGGCGSNLVTGLIVFAGTFFRIGMAGAQGPSADSRAKIG